MCQSVQLQTLQLCKAERDTDVSMGGSEFIPFPKGSREQMLVAFLGSSVK